jgi:hypothetical protein
MLPRLAVLGPAEIIVRRQPVRLTPSTLAVLLRLALDPSEVGAAESVIQTEALRGRAARELVYG